MNTQDTAVNAAPHPMPPDVVLSQMIWGGLMQQCICVAVKLGIPDLLAEKPQTVAELATQTETHESSLYRVLRLLASAGVFAKNSDGKFELTPIAELLRKDAPNSMRDFAILLGEDWMWHAWLELMYSVKTGEVAHEKVQGMSSFEYFEKNEKAGKVFNRAMTNLSQMVVPAIVEAYDFSGAAKIVDIAGGHGFLLSGILKANPHLHGVLFDLPYVIENAGELLEKEGVASRVELVSGDFFESVAAGGDIYIMKHIIHDWNDGRSVKILQSIHRAMNENGKLLIVEMVVPEGNEPSPSKMLDIEMLVMEGGKERTEKEYRDLLAAADFRLTRIVPTRSPYSIVEAVKS
jgi:ubiquinone/menaquinone biosynthesis C-methylase UbiE